MCCGYVYEIKFSVFCIKFLKVKSEIYIYIYIYINNEQLNKSEIHPYLHRCLIFISASISQNNNFCFSLELANWYYYDTFRKSEI